MVDVCAAKSMPTENLDAMKVAMVLVRVLQVGAYKISSLFVIVAHNKTF